ncbi:ERF family protein [Arthrobacter sp. KNU40]|uniref:ERF family protein n=1 Tax=Arthrobacter sp. KNU40 TaxID=3447965 RepID=UPI003F6430CF
MDEPVETPANGVDQLFVGIPASIAKAIIAIQAKVQALEKTAKNDHFKNAYAPLEEVMEAALPLITKHKLGLMQWPVTKDGKHYLHTVLLHETGANLQADIELLLVKQDPQGLGSAITYTRRQTVMAILGLSAKGEDDDGNKASNHLPQPTSEQITQIITICKDLKYPEEEVQKRLRTIKTFDHAVLAISRLERVISGRARALKSGEGSPIEVATDSEPPVEDRHNETYVKKRLAGFGFKDNKTITAFIRATTGKPLLGNCKSAELQLLNEAMDRIESGEESLPPDWRESDQTEEKSKEVTASENKQ